MFRKFFFILLSGCFLQAGQVHPQISTNCEMSDLEIHISPNQYCILPLSYCFYPGFNLTVYAFSYDGRSGVELSDGTVLSVASLDQAIVESWRINDLVVFFPRQEGFSSYELLAVNLSNGTEIRVDVQEGPFFASLQMKQIEVIDFSNHVLRLTDGSMWKMWGEDLLRFQTWKAGDIVIPGCNSTQNSDSILFNLNISDPSRKYNFAHFIGV